MDPAQRKTFARRRYFAKLAAEKHSTGSCPEPVEWPPAPHPDLAGPMPAPKKKPRLAAPISHAEATRRREPVGEGGAAALTPVGKRPAYPRDGGRCSPSSYCGEMWASLTDQHKGGLKLFVLEYKDILNPPARVGLPWQIKSKYRAEGVRCIVALWSGQHRGIGVQINFCPFCGTQLSPWRIGKDQTQKDSIVAKG